MRWWGGSFLLLIFGSGAYFWWAGTLPTMFAALRSVPIADSTAPADELKPVVISEPLPIVQENRRETTSFIPIQKEFAPNLHLTTPHAAVVLDADTRKALFASAPHERRQVASLTKLMTALIVMERITDLDEPVRIDEEAARAEGTRVGCPRSGYCNDIRLRPGEHISVRNLLKAALMNSANDAAIALGKHIGGTQAGFATIMNERARALGLTDSHFCTPSGLEPEGREQECYSTAHDMAVIAVEVLRYDILWEYMRLEKDEITSTDGALVHTIFNTSELLGVQPHLIGTKTGYTPLAGRSLLAVAADPTGKHRVVAVVLDDPYRWQTVRSMFDWSFEAFEWK